MADRSLEPDVSVSCLPAASGAGAALMTGSPTSDATPIGHVGPQVMVRLQYQLFDAEGTLVEAPGPDESIEFIFGAGQAPAAIERAVAGLTVGQSRRVQLDPKQAFGERDEDAVVVVERGELPASAAFGDEFEAENDAGELVFLRVLEIDDEVARLDANHPLAGQRVTLELLVLLLRAATSAELVEAAAELARRQAGAEPDVLASGLLRRDRFTPPASG